MVDPGGLGAVCDDREEKEARRQMELSPHEVEFYSGAHFVDDITGEELPWREVVKARRKELQFIESKPLYEVRPTAEASRSTGRPPISTKWLDIYKGGGNWRSRWVARQFNDGSDQGEYFAATPPFEAIKLLVSLAASQKSTERSRGKRGRPRDTTTRGRTAPSGAVAAPSGVAWGTTAMAGAAPRGVDAAPSGADGFTTEVRYFMERARAEGPLKISVIDVSRAHFQAKAETDIYVELPEERREPGTCGKLLYNLYGTRCAAQGWENEYSKKLESWGYRRLKCCPVAFMHPTEPILIVCHGDDFVNLGTDRALDSLKASMHCVRVPRGRAHRPRSRRWQGPQDPESHSRVGTRRNLYGSGPAAP